VKDEKSCAEKERPGPRAGSDLSVRTQQANRSTGWDGFAKPCVSRIVPMAVSRDAGVAACVPGGGDFGCHHFRIFHRHHFASWREFVLVLALCC
jgi:hypothetical protein